MCLFFLSRCAYNFIAIYNYVKSTVKNIVGSIKGINEDYLEKFSCPVAVIGRQGDIVWCNSRFRKAMCGGKGAEGDNIKAYLWEKKLTV